MIKAEKEITSELILLAFYTLGVISAIIIFLGMMTWVFQTPPQLPV